MSAPPRAPCLHPRIPKFTLSDFLWVPKAHHSSVKWWPPQKVPRSTAPTDRPKNDGMAQAKQKPAEIRMFPAQLMQTRVDGINPQRVKHLNSVFPNIFRILHQTGVGRLMEAVV